MLMTLAVSAGSMGSAHSPRLRESGFPCTEKIRPHSPLDQDMTKKIVSTRMFVGFEIVHNLQSSFGDTLW